MNQAYRKSDVPALIQKQIDAANARADNAVAHSKRVPESYTWITFGVASIFCFALIFLNSKIAKLTRSRDSLIASNILLREQASASLQLAESRDPARGGPPITDVFDERFTPPTVLVAERNRAESALMDEMEHRYGRPTPSEEAGPMGRVECYLLNPTSEQRQPRRRFLTFDDDGCVSRASIEYNRRLGIAVRSWNTNGELCPGSSPPFSSTP